MNISDNTLKTYKYALSHYVNKSLLKDANKQYLYLKNKGYSNDTIKISISAIMYFIKNEEIEGDYEGYKEILKKLRAITDEEFKNHDLIKNNYIPDYEDLIKLRDFYKNELDKIDKKGSLKYKILNRKYLLMCLYTYMPPRRLLDYKTMIIMDNLTNYNKFISKFIDINNLKYYCKEDDNKGKLQYLKGDSKINNNFYLIKEGLFIYWNYKTWKVMGTQIIKVDEDLNNIIKNYINNLNLVNGDLLFKGKDLTLLVNETCRINGKLFGINSIRHSFIIWYYNKTGISELLNKLTELTRLMGQNNIITNMNYYKNLDNKDIENDSEEE